MTIVVMHEDGIVTVNGQFVRRVFFSLHLMRSVSVVSSVCVQFDGREKRNINFTHKGKIDEQQTLIKLAINSTYSTF